jgi:O-antigen/teichoic acid export membrane protein
VAQVNPFFRYGGYVFSAGGARLIGLLITSSTFPYVVRHLGVEMYGLWSYVVAVRTFLDVVADPGITTHATQQLAARRIAGLELVPDVLVLRLLCSSIAAIILLVFAAFEVRHTVAQLLWIYGIGSLLVNLLSSDSFLLSLEMFHVRAVLTVLQQVLYAATIFAFLHSPRDVIWLPISILGSSALAGIAGWTILSRRSEGNLTAVIHPQAWKGILGPSLHYAGSSLMSNFYRRAGLILVRWLIGDFALGIYAAVTRLLDLLRSFVIIVSQVMMPRMALSARSGAGFSRLARFSVGAMAVISFPIAAGLFGAAPVILPWVLGANFAAGVPLLRWMSAYLVAAPMAFLFAGTILFSLGKHRAYFAATGAGAATGLILYLTLIPRLGLRGAGVALVLAEFVVAIIAYNLLPELRGSWKNPLIGIALGGALLILVSVRIVGTYAPQSTAAIWIGVLVYIASCGWPVRKFLMEQSLGL